MELSTLRGDAQASALEQTEQSSSLLTQAEQAVASAGASMEQTRNSVSESVADLVRAQERLRGLDAELTERRRLADQIRASRARLEKAGSAASLMTSIDFRQCPRCLQAVEVGRVDGSHCYVCTQPEPETRGAELADPDRAIDAERTRLHSLEAEIEELDTVARSEHAALEATRRKSARRIDQAEGELKEMADLRLQPAVDTIRTEAANAAAAEESIRQIDSQLLTWAERTRLLAPIAELQAELKRKLADLQRAEQRVAGRRSRVGEVSDLFDEIIQELQMPWYETGAYIDERSYLPVVNGVDMRELGSGGMKMMTNVAYHLALLTYGLANRLDTLPDLLIIDSPRKNLGASEQDQAHAKAFYRWISTMTHAYEGRFQLIVADNDEPPTNTPLVHHVRLSHKEPLIRDLKHPGEGVETIGSE